MNLICKLKRFTKLRHKGVKMKVALREFNQPLTDGDKYALTLIVFIGLTFIAMAYKDEIDATALAHQAQAEKAIERLEIANKSLFSVTKEKEHIELVLVSALNGQFVENGRKVTTCIIGAHGECR